MSFSLGSDNHSGVHPEIMKALSAVNVEHAPAYGLDEVTEATKAEWRKALGADAEVFYVFNGTAANVLSLQAFLKPFEAVICSEQGHIANDECGAPEKFLGSKLYLLPSNDGKIRPEQVLPLLRRRGDQHFATPKMISLTLPTELGVCYTLEELKNWRAFANQNHLYLHYDGARLPNALAFLNITLKELITAGAPDALSFGGTKNGLLGVEAVLLFDKGRTADFKYIRKQGMQLASKSRYLAAQFSAFLKNDLYLDIARHVTMHAKKLEAQLIEFPEIKVQFPVESNALFVSLPKAWLAPIRDEFFFYIWDVDTSTARWMISFDWTDATTKRLLEHIRKVKAKWPV